MFIVRNVFKAKPGKAKALVEIFKNVTPMMVDTGVVNSVRVLTDSVADFWTVVVESETDDLNTYVDMAKVVSKEPKIGEAMKGYIDLVESGSREVLRIE